MFHIGFNRLLAIALQAVLCTILLPRVCIASQPVWSQQILETKTGTLLLEGVTEPTGSIQHPAVLILCGTKGFFRPAYKNMALSFAQAGMDAYLVHYLNESDHQHIEKAGSAAARIRYYATRQAEWISDVRLAAKTISAHSQRKIGLLGLSLGAQVAAAVSANNNRFSALVLVDGGFPNHFQQPLTSMPALQLIWGEADRAFPVTGAKSLEARIKKLGRPVALTTYPGMSHGFILQEDKPEAKAAWLVAAHFLKTQLAQ
jgi:dienelactone hydrolase